MTGYRRSGQVVSDWFRLVQIRCGYIRLGQVFSGNVMLVLIMSDSFRLIQFS
jgi:hypothetical protein